MDLENWYLLVSQLLMDWRQSRITTKAGEQIRFGNNTHLFGWNLLDFKNFWYIKHSPRSHLLPIISLPHSLLWVSPTNSSQSDSLQVESQSSCKTSPNRGIYWVLLIHQPIRKPSETPTHHHLNPSSFLPSVWSGNWCLIFFDNIFWITIKMVSFSTNQNSQNVQ